VASTIERLEGARFAMFENHTGARQPVHAVAVDEVPNNIVDIESLSALVVHSPVIRQIAEKRVERGWRTFKQSDGVLKIVVHKAASRTVYPGQC